FSLYGIVFAAVEGNQRALISDLVKEKNKATALGVFHTAVGVFALPSSLIAGYLWAINPNYTFLFGGLIGLLSSVIFYNSKI
ncbi:MAG: MFS transporter, partial [Candidatus Thorarchaeota archaeon]